MIDDPLLKLCFFRRPGLLAGIPWAWPDRGELVIEMPEISPAEFVVRDDYATDSTPLRIRRIARPSRTRRARLPAHAEQPRLAVPG